MKIAAVGDNCMDVYDSLGTAYPGGNPVNVAVNFTRLGGQAAYLGAVGTDRYGDLMQDALKKKGVNLSHIHVIEGSTAITHVDMDGSNRVLGDYDPGVMDQFKLTDADIDFISGQDLMVSVVWGMVEHDLWKVKARGVPIVFDCADHTDSPVLEVALPQTDYAFFGLDLPDDEKLREFLIAQHKKGPKVVVATLGAAGSIAWDGHEFCSCPAVPCNVVDTMGAGDSYIAGFIHALLQGHPLEDCMKSGAQSAAYTIGFSGAW